jgi:hypothetical protein
VSPRLGLVAYGTATGLGYQTKAIHDHLRPAKTLLIDLSHRKRLPLHPEWFPGAQVVRDAPTMQDIAAFLDGLDVVLACETPANYALFDQARKRGIRSILQHNFEFLDYFRDPWLSRPTVFAAPSPWNVHRMGQGPFPIVWELPVPVDPTGILQRQVTEARTFLHIGGRPAAYDRNGSLDFIYLAGRCRDLDAEWVVTCQSPTEDITRALRGSDVTLVADMPEPADLYRVGDVMVLPRRFGGLCMPAREAVTAGMPVIMPRIDPNTTWLPGEWLIPAAVSGSFMAKTRIDLYQTDMGALEALVRRLHADPGLVQEWAKDARDIATRWTWDALLPVYRTFLDRVMELKP